MVKCSDVSPASWYSHGWSCGLSLSSPALATPPALSRGQLIYVPVYSQIFFGDRQQSFNLSVTLSLRNTDLTHPIEITSVRYYDEKGKLVKDFAPPAITIAPLASARFYRQGIRCFRRLRGLFPGALAGASKGQSPHYRRADGGDLLRPGHQLHRPRPGAGGIFGEIIFNHPEVLTMLALISSPILAGYTRWLGWLGMSVFHV